MPWEIKSTQSEEAWQDDYINQIIFSESPKLPPHEGSLGQTSWYWDMPDPGEYHIILQGGSIADRLLTQQYISGQLESFGLKRSSIHWSVSYSPQDRDQVTAKALRLIRTNKVQVHNNLPNFLNGTVQGDTEGVHNVEIQRDPNVSPRNQNGIISGSCDCSWGQFMNTPRTRNYKEYANAPCAHLIALWWLGQAMPVDNGEENPLPNGQGDVSQFTPLHQQPLMNFAPNQPLQNIPGITPQAPNTDQRSFSPDENGYPNPELALPQPQQQPIDVDPNGSVPGKKPQTPSNPIQYPGGTYSAIKESADQFAEGQMVQLKEDDYGTMVGDPGYGGVGQSILLPAGSIGEIRGIDQATGMLELFVNGGPFLQMGRGQAMGATAWVWSSAVFARPDLRGGSPIVKRT